MNDHAVPAAFPGRMNRRKGSGRGQGAQEARDLDTQGRHDFSSGEDVLRAREGRVTKTTVAHVPHVFLPPVGAMTPQIGSEIPSQARTT